MFVKVNVRTNCRQEKIEKIDKNEYKIWVKEPAKDNKANEAVINIISDTLGVRKSSIQITKGLKSKSKLIKI